MMGQIKYVFLLMLFGIFLCGCGRAEGNALVIGRSDEEAGGVQPSALGEVAKQTEGTETSAEKTEIRVYVCGAVKNPGVVTLKTGERVEDALKAAGGFSEDADRNAVNLAGWVSDGERIYFLTKEEAEKQEERESSPESGFVNINTADAAALCTLPGIGESRARDIIAYREQNGGFKTTEDIMNVSGIKTSLYEKIKDKITVK